MREIYHISALRKSAPLPLVDFLRQLVKRIVLRCYVHRVLTLEQTQRVIDAFRLWEA